MKIKRNFSLEFKRELVENIKAGVMSMEVTGTFVKLLSCFVVGIVLDKFIRTI